MYIEAVDDTKQELKYWAGKETWNICCLVQSGLYKLKSLLFNIIFTSPWNSSLGAY